MKKSFLFFITLLGALIIGNMISCNNKTASEKTSATDDEAFYASQPVHSGLYDADSYDITGANPRKGKFDGRIYFSLSPDLSAFYVFENGNRTKIHYTVSLQKPFEKGDSGIYKTVDAAGMPVTIAADSTIYILNFQKNNSEITIGFNPKPRHTGTAIEILERMNETMQKNK